MFKFTILFSAVASFALCSPQNYFFINHYRSAPNQPSERTGLSERQQIPPTIYGSPQPEYGPPEPSTTTEAATTTEIPTTTEVQTEENIADNLSEKLKDGQEGAYYFLHPSGLLQKVTFATKEDLENMAYYAKLQYEDIEPIKGPIYTYIPETSELRRIARKTDSLEN